MFSDKGTNILFSNKYGLAVDTSAEEWMILCCTYHITTKDFHCDCNTQEIIVS